MSSTQRPLALVELPDGSVRVEAGSDALTLNAGEFEKFKFLLATHPAKKGTS